MNRAELTEMVRATAQESGAALVGFGPVSRFDNAPPELHPHTIYPQTKTVVAVAVPQGRGTLKAVEEGTYWNAYNCDSYWYLNEVVAPQILRAMMFALEEHGYTSVPVHNPFHPHSGRRTREDQPAGPDGMISLRVVGVACGLGELGMSKIFLTPQYGPRQRVFALFTDAELEPTPLFEGKVCDECGACARACEADAIGTERSELLEIEGRTFGHARFDYDACAWVHKGGDPSFSPFWNGSEPEGEMPSYNQYCQRRFRHLAICVGRGCLRACLAHLEETGRIEKKFKTPFRKRPPWKIEPLPPKA